MPYPDALSLEEIGTGGAVLSSPLRNNYSEVQTEFNKLQAFFAGLASAADGQVAVWSGSGWTVGSAGAAVATTVAGLGAGSSGKVGLLRLGSTPFEFVSLIYDATYGKWVSAPLAFAFAAANSSNPTAYTDIPGVGGSIPWATHDAAGLVPQVRFRAQFKSSDVAQTASMTVAGKGVDDDGTIDTLASADAFTAIEETTTSTSFKLRQSAWHTVTGITVEDMLVLTLQRKISNSGHLVDVKNPVIEVRWVSA